MAEIIFVETDLLWRRVHPEQMVKIADTGKHRPSSAAFTNTTGTDEMSVDAAKLRNSTQETIQHHPDNSVAEFSVGFARSLEQRVAHQPLSDNPAHSAVIGQKTKATMRKFAKNSQWAFFQQPN